MSHRSRRLSFIALALAAFGPRAATAQTEGPDVATKTPNIMLLVDTSGSMEWKSTTKTAPACVPDTVNTGATTDLNEKSRWIELVEALTGTIQNYSCFSESRSSTQFSDEFSIVQGAATYRPLDYRYIDDYHRPLSNKCAPGPGDLGTNPWEFSANPIKYRTYAGGLVSPTTYCAASSFQQSNDGLLDAYSGVARFGLMTFDTEVDPGTGISGADATYGVVKGTADYKSGIQGAWSYYLPTGTGCKRSAGSGSCKSVYGDGTSSSSPDGCCAGGPTNCITLIPEEVGSRNMSAPPWEGRMVAFGPTADDNLQRNSWIQQELLATRPYGSTPIAGMLHDAQDFFWYDQTKDPLNPASGVGPIGDPQVTGGCRQNYVILLTDGEPNMDLRTACEGSPNNCPFDRPEDITNQLMRPADATKPKVRTFVIGFALDTVILNGSPTSCSAVSPTDPACATATGSLKTCCTLNAIAYNGTPTADQASTDPTVIKSAIFPKNAAQLKAAIGQALGSATAALATRTYPVTATAPLADRPSVAYQFQSGEDSNALRSQAYLARSRFICDGAPLAPRALPVSQADGDDFVANVNAQPTTRTLFTVGPPSGVVSWNGARSVRPYFETALEDGVLHGSGVPTPYAAPVDMRSYVTSTMLNVTAASCGATTAAACAQQLTDWYAGVPAATPSTRCVTTGSDKCSVIGDIFRSVPQLRYGPPNEGLTDPSYVSFAGLNKTRDTVLYTSTNDGFFHGFLVYPGKNVDTRKVTAKKPNELFGFVPPAMLPYVLSMYPAGRQYGNVRVPVNDGTPVISDVEATQGGTRALNTTTTSTLYYPYRLERKRFPATGETHTWRTVSVQSFGTNQAGYYAVDITSPTVDTSDTTAGPRFLWQLTTDDAGKQIFGKGTPTPLVTTLFVNLTALGIASGETTREVPVAVLSGGTGDSLPSGTGCNPGPSATISAGSAGPTTSTFTRQTRCYNNTPANIAARSVTIVRLDTGQILRTFRPTLPTGILQPVTFQSSVLTTQEIPAPITGTAAAYPGRVGTVADRIFVGDAEGRVWRIDTSDPNPANWKMQVFFDAYYDLGTSTIVPQAIQTPPILSVTDGGALTVAFSTGSQDNLNPDPTLTNYVVSGTEFIQNTGGVKDFQSRFNWRQTFTAGERVLGPMVLFDRFLYFPTYTPAAGTLTCDVGSSRVYGEDYVLPKTGSSSLTGGQPPTGTAFATNTGNYIPQTGIVGSIGLRQQPSCAANTVASTDSVDDYLGYGKTTTTTSMSSAGFELVFNKSGGGNTGGASASTAVGTISLPTPRLPARIDSWAPIIE